MIPGAKYSGPLFAKISTFRVNLRPGAPLLPLQVIRPTLSLFVLRTSCEANESSSLLCGCGRHVCTAARVKPIGCPTAPMTSLASSFLYLSWADSYLNVRDVSPHYRAMATANIVLALLRKASMMGSFAKMLKKMGRPSMKYPLPWLYCFSYSFLQSLSCSSQLVSYLFQLLVQ